MFGSSFPSLSPPPFQIITLPACLRDGLSGCTGLKNRKKRYHPQMKLVVSCPCWRTVVFKKKFGGGAHLVLEGQILGFSSSLFTDFVYL